MQNLPFRKFLRILNELYKENGDIYHSLAKHFGLLDCAFWILYSLREENRPQTQAELCESLFLPKQTVHSALKKLEAAGYIRLENASENRRNKEIHLTTDGVAFAEQTIDPVFEVEHRAFLALTIPERAGLLALERKHTDALRCAAAEILRGD